MRLRHEPATWPVTIASALRLFGIAWTMAVTPVHTTDDAAGTVIDDLGRRPSGGQRPLARKSPPKKARASADRGGGRSSSRCSRSTPRAWSRTARCSGTRPAVAVVGDMVLAMLFSFWSPCRCLVVPRVDALARTAGVAAGTRAPARTTPAWRRLARAWLRYRLRVAVRLREARYSLPAALWRSLAAGLPVAAIVAATVPVWGMSWFFDTENWASGHLELLGGSAHRHVARSHGARRRRPAGATRPFAVTAAGHRRGDFSFIVIGDPGEGDASQHVPARPAADRRRARRRAVRRDQVRRRLPERLDDRLRGEFWLPFKGVTKPVFAIPGNHDWYDALEGVPGDVPAARRRARGHAGARGGGPADDQHHERRASTA